MQFFEKWVFFGKINNLKEKKYMNAEIIRNTHLFPFHNEPSPMPVG